MTVRLDPSKATPRHRFYGVTFNPWSPRLVPLWLRNKAAPRFQRLLEWKYDNEDEQVKNVGHEIENLFSEMSYTEDGRSMESFIDGLDEDWNPIHTKRTNFNPFNFANSVYYLYLYMLVRKLKPQIAIESGVFLGGSSASILRAMQENGRGKLISIEISERIEFGMWKKYSLPAGFAVPEYLKPRWQLIIGDSRSVLPKLLSDAGPIDFFLHDSDHTLETMSFEMGHAWPSLREGSVMVCDDANLSMAVYEFAVKNRVSPWLLSRDGIYPDTLAIFLK